MLIRLIIAELGCGALSLRLIINCNRILNSNRDSTPLFIAELREALKFVRVVIFISLPNVIARSNKIFAVILV